MRWQPPEEEGKEAPGLPAMRKPRRKHVVGVPRRKIVLILEILFYGCAHEFCAAALGSIQPGFVEELGRGIEAIGDGVPGRVARGFRRQPVANRLLHQFTVRSEEHTSELQSLR